MYPFTKSGLIIVLTGPTSSGKDSVIQKIIAKRPQIRKLVTTTTRSPREGEVEGKDYYFIGQNDFKKMFQNGEFLETKEYGGNWYGTTLAEFKKTPEGQDAIWRVEPTMAAKAKEYFHHAVVIYINVSSKQTLEKRLKGRGTSQDDINIRLKQDEEDWSNLKNSFDYVIDNSDGKLDQAVEQILEIIDAKKLLL